MVLLGRSPQPGQPRVLFSWDTFQRLQVHCHSDTVSEVGGALLGKAYQYEGEIFVEARACLPVQSADHGPIHFTFNADSWSQLHEDRSLHHPELDIVGWFHTHPGLGVFFSADDVVVHTAAFVLPWHVALVVDPVREEMGLFAWRRGQVVPVSGFYGLPPAEAWERLTWRLVPAEVWEDTYEERLRRRTAAEQHRQRQDAQASEVRTWLGVAIGALGIILSLGLLLGGVLPLSRENEALSEVVLALGDQNLAIASEAGVASCPDPDVRIYAPRPGSEVRDLQAMAIVGLANHPQADAYQIELRPQGEQTWWPVRRFRGAESLQTLWRWDSEQWNPGQFRPGAYELRLAALDDTDELLDSPSPCIVSFDVRHSDTLRE